MGCLESVYLLLTYFLCSLEGVARGVASLSMSLNRRCRSEMPLMLTLPLLLPPPLLLSDPVAVVVLELDEPDTESRLAEGAVAPVAHDPVEKGERKWAVDGVGVVDEEIVIRLLSLILCVNRVDEVLIVVVDEKEVSV